MIRVVRRGADTSDRVHVGPTVVHVHAEIIAGVGAIVLRRLAGAAAQRVVTMS
jgi:hypothetical protein